jgi:hypothetical protein
MPVMLALLVLENLLQARVKSVALASSSALQQPIAIAASVQKEVKTERSARLHLKQITMTFCMAKEASS